MSCKHQSGHPKRSYISMAVAGAIVSLCISASGLAEEITYNGTAEDYETLQDVILYQSGPSEQLLSHVLMPRQISGNTIKISDPGGLASTGEYHSPGDVFGGFSDEYDTEVSGNTITVDGGTVGSVNGGWSRTGTAHHNTLNLIDGSVINFIGGYTNGYRADSGLNSNLAVAESNTVNISGGTVNGTAAGGWATNGVARNNTIDMTGGTVNALIGGRAANTGSLAEGNIANISGGTVSGDAAGGQTINGTARNNTINMTEGIVNRFFAVYVNGYVGVAEGNIANISGGTVSGDAAGGWAIGGTARNNTINMTGGGAGGVFAGYAAGTGAVAEENTVNISGGTVEANAHGGVARNGGTARNNTLILSDGTVSGVFAGYTSGTGAVAEGNTADISGGTVEVNAHGGVAMLEGIVKNNTLNIHGGTVAGSAYGGYAAGAGTALNNTLILSDGTVNQVFAGHATGTGAVAEGNTAIISGGTVKASAHGGIARDGGTARNNALILSDGTVSGVFAGYTSGTGAVAEGNTADISGGTVEVNAHGGVAMLEGIVKNNTLNIHGGTVAGSAYGGYAAGAGTALNNTLILSDGTVNQVFAGYATGTGAVAEGNTASISGGTVTTDAFAVSADYGSAGRNNTLNLTGGSVNGIYGGRANGTGSLAEGNTAIISGGTVKANAHGGVAMGGGAIKNNTLKISGGTVTGDAYGGYIISGTAENNTLILSGGKVTRNAFGIISGTGDATHHTVRLEGGVVGGVVFGGYSFKPPADVFTGNRLIVANSGGTTLSAGGVQNFEYIDFDLSSSGVTLTDPLLSVSGNVVFGSAASSRGSIINLAGVGSSGIGRQVLLTSGGAFQGTYSPELAVGGSQTSVDYMTASLLTVGNNTLVADYQLSWLNPVSDNAHGTFTLAGAGETFNVGTALTDNASVVQNTNIHGWDGKSLTKAGQGTLILTGDNTYTGSTVISDGTLQLGNGGTTGSVAGNIDNSGTLVFNRNDDITYSHVVSGNGSVIKTGDNTLTLTGNNTYTGDTAISAGTLQIGNGLLSGSVSGNITNNAALVFNRSDAMTYGGVISGNGNMTKTGNNILTLTGDNTYTGTTTIKSGTLQIGNGGTTGSVNGNIINDGILAFNRSDEMTYNGQISGSGSLSKTGDNALTLTGNSTYTGGTSVNGGTLVLANINGAGTGDIKTVGNSNLALSGVTGTFHNTVSGRGNISVTGGADITADTSASGTLITVSDDSRLTLSSGSLWKATRGFTNDGIVALNNSSSLSGDFDNRGTLLMGNGRDTPALLTGNLQNSGSIALSSDRFGGNRLIVDGNYTGSEGSSVNMNATLRGDNDSVTDKLTILGNSAGTSTVYVTNGNGSGAQTLEGVRMISVTGDSDAQFTQGARIVAGEYDYSLVKKEKDWYLTSHKDDYEGKSRQYRPEMAGYAANLQASNTLFTHSLSDRAGSGTDGSSLWMRNTGSQSKSDMTDNQNSVTMNRYVVQLGGDVFSYSTPEYGHFTAGVMGGYAQANGKTDNSASGYGARNSVKGYGLGMYGTWYADEQKKQGLYADTWLQYNWFRNKISGDDLAEEKYDSRGLTASLETGYNQKVADWGLSSEATDSVWIQPHLQAVWMGVKAKGHTEFNGTRVESSGENNIQTRLGVRGYLSHQSRSKEGLTEEVNPYIEANWLHNTKDYSVQMNESGHDRLAMKNVAELKVGVEAKTVSRLSIRAEVSGTRGKNDYSDIGAHLGVKFEF
ncbi:TPA: autotransporter outer membrane beta-barrel domain-containing protein [Morganella morganii]|nr:autotransporter outer membrane beta-barrel domain-containing protein [Morganella morganii]